MKINKFLFGFSLFFSLNGVSQHLVNYDYSFNPPNAYTPSNNGNIGYNLFPDFNLPNRFRIVYQAVFAHNSQYDIMINKGFTHTVTYTNQLEYQYPLGQSIAPWESPVNIRAYQYNTITNTCYGGFDLLNPTKYADAKKRYEYKFKQGVSLGYNQSNNTCDPPPAGNISVTQDPQNIASTYINNGGIVSKNLDMVLLDFEQVFNIERYFGVNGPSSFLPCVQDFNCASTHPTYGGYDFMGALTQRINMPSAYENLPYEDFRKAWYRAKLKEYYCPIDAYKSVNSTSSAAISNYSMTFEDPKKMHDAFTNNIPWTNALTNPDNLGYLAKDTTNFTTLGNYYVNALDDITPDCYLAWAGRNGEWSYESGTWLSHFLENQEFNKYWAKQLNKPMIPYLWLKNDGFLADDPNIPNGNGPGEEQPNPDYGKFSSPENAEGQAIFTIMSGSDGLILWDGEWSYWTNQHVHDYFIKGLHRLSHFNSFLENESNVQYVYDLDPWEIKHLEATQTQTAIWRGIVKGDSILVAAMNPYASNSNAQTQCIVNYQGWADTITLTGRQIFLGSAKWNDGTMVSCSTLDWGPNTNSTCNGQTTQSVSTTGASNVEYSSDNGSTWHASNGANNTYTWTFPATPNLISYLAREVGCTDQQYYLSGGLIGQSTCSTSSINSLELENLSIIPNPAINSFKIQLSDKGNDPFDVRIVNLFGELIYQNYSMNSGESIDVSNVAEGLYLVKISSNGNTVTKRFVKQSK